jgi:hypothetical protein
MCSMAKSKRSSKSYRTMCTPPGLIVTLGGCDLGIFSAAMPVEALHAVEGGLCKDLAVILFKQDLKDASCGRPDVLVECICSMDKQHYMTSGSNKAMPRILFKDKVTSLAKLPSSHVIGILLTIVIVPLTDEGISLFEEVFHPTGSKTGITERLNNMRYVFSMMLSYWSWLKQDY